MLPVLSRYELPTMNHEQKFSPSFAKCYQYTFNISYPAFVQAENIRTFAARKWGNGFSKAIRKIKKIKFAVVKKVLTFAVPKQGALKSEKTESDFQFKNWKSDHLKRGNR